MAKISSFRVDTKAIESGEWVSPGEEFDDLEILTRGFTDAYTDSRSARTRKAAIPFGGDVSKIPSVVGRNILVDCLVRHVLLDVRNLQDDDGESVKFPAFCTMLGSGDYPDLLRAAVQAANKVGVAKATDTADAVGNSPTPSA